MIDLKNKKGFAIELLMLVIIGFICLIFFAAWMYGSDLINTQLLSFTGTSNSTNISAATEATYSYVNTGMDSLKTIGFLIIIAFSFSTLIVGYYSAQKPIFLFIYILFIILTVIFSIYVSNSYETLLSNEVLGSKLSEFSAGNWIMLNLPIWIAVIGFIGIVISIVGRYIIRD